MASSKSMLVNLLAPVATPLPDERFDILAQSPYTRIERIVSRQHATPPGQWYDQETDEFVVLMAGSAALQIDGAASPIVMKPGDTLFLPAHQRHRVEWTDPLVDTIWLAIHVSPA